MVDISLPEGRICTKCGVYKSLAEFGPHARGKYGRQPKCRKCCNATKKAWNLANRGLVAERKRRYSARTSVRNVARATAWAAANPGKANANWVRGKNKRRVRKASAGGSHTPEQWLDLVERAKGRCCICGKKGHLTRDHIIPLSRGGIDDITNIQPLCRSCNSRKNSHLLYLL
jgi:5-methylcytosine-specific restriction endonuclease McrA